MEMSVKPVKVVIPENKKNFEKFYQSFDKVSEIVESSDWKDYYSAYYDFDKYELDIDIHETAEEIERYDPKRQVQEIIKCANSFEYWCHKYVKIAHPTYGLISFKTFKYQRRVISDYDDHRFNILSKFRQGGLTTASVLWALWRCLFQTDLRIMIVSKTDREAIAAGEIAKTAMDYLPGWMKPEMGKCNEHERQFTETGCVLWCYTVEAARGKSISLLIIDEAAFITDMDKHWKSIYPTIATGGACCVISTVNGMGNWYEEMYHEAGKDDNPFHIIDLDYWEHPEYNTPKWERDTKANLGPKGWQQEILRSFLGSGETFIPMSIITKHDKFTQEAQPLRVLFPKWANLGKNDDDVLEKGAMWLWKEPQEGREYIIAADCAEGIGSDGDNSAFQVLDMNTLEQVAEFYSNSIPPHIFAQVISQIGRYYNTALVVIEHNNQGTAVVQSLQHVVAYDNLYYDPKGKQTTAGVKTGKTNRLLMLEALQNRLLNDAIKINSKRFVAELKTFIFNKNTKKAEAQRGRHDDAIMSMSLALYIRDSQIRDVPVGAAIAGDMPQIRSELFEEIKKEILSGSPDEWLPTEEDNDIQFSDNIEINIKFAIPRKQDKLLKEFGW